MHEPAEIAAALADQVHRPVLWAQSMELAVAECGVTHFFDVGAGRVLTGLARHNAPSAVCVPIETWDDIAAYAANPLLRCERSAT